MGDGKRRVASLLRVLQHEKAKMRTFSKKSASAIARPLTFSAP